MMDNVRPLAINPFPASCILTTIVFSGLGFLKCVVTKTKGSRGIAEMQLLGTATVLIVFLVGSFFQELII